MKAYFLCNYCNKENLMKAAGISSCVIIGAVAPLLAMKVASFTGIIPTTGAALIANLTTVPLLAENLRNVNIKHGHYPISAVAVFIGGAIALSLTVGTGAVVGGSLLGSFAIGLSIGSAVSFVNFWGTRKIQQYYSN